MQNFTKSQKQIKAIKAKSLRWSTSVKGAKYIKEYRKKYYLKNKKKIRRYNDLWIQNNKAKHDKARRRYSRLNAVKERLRSRDWRRALRIEVIKLLGGKCARCRIKDHRALQIDHVNSDGPQDRLNTGTAYLTRVRNHIKRGGKRYQLLCANHNWIKRHEQKEFGGRTAK